MRTVVIADRYQCPKVDGKYQTEHKILKRKGMKVTQEYVDQMNAQDNGILFVVDNQATEANKQEYETLKGLRKAKDSREQLAKGKNLDALIEAATQGTRTEVIVPKAKNKKPKLADLREQYPHIKANSVDAFLLKVREAEEAASEEQETEENSEERLTNRPEESDSIL